MLWFKQAIHPPNLKEAQEVMTATHKIARLIAALEHFRRAGVPTLHQASILATIAAKPDGATYKQISLILGSIDPTSAGAVCRSLAEHNLVRVESHMEVEKNKRDHYGDRRIMKVYPTPYLKDLVRAVEHDVWGD